MGHSVLCPGTYQVLIMCGYEARARTGARSCVLTTMRSCARWDTLLAQQKQERWLQESGGWGVHRAVPVSRFLPYCRRPLEVAAPPADIPFTASHPQVAAEAASFGAALLLDLWTGRLQANEQQRAEQLRGVIERLGPA